jgi:hypothetical protein
MAVVVAAPNMAATKDTAGALPVRRLSKDELVNTHKTHLEKQDNSPNAPRAVKQPIMSDAYPASTKSIRDLEIVIQLSFFSNQASRG